MLVAFFGKTTVLRPSGLEPWVRVARRPMQQIQSRKTIRLVVVWTQTWCPKNQAPRANGSSIEDVIRLVNLQGSTGCNKSVQSRRNVAIPRASLPLPNIQSVVGSKANCPATKLTTRSSAFVSSRIPLDSKGISASCDNQLTLSPMWNQ